MTTVLAIAGGVWLAIAVPVAIGLGRAIRHQDGQQERPRLHVIRP